VKTLVFGFEAVDEFFLLRGGEAAEVVRGTAASETSSVQLDANASEG
jgi:hypothetical protein